MIIALFAPNVILFWYTAKEKEVFFLIYYVLVRKAPKTIKIYLPLSEKKTYKEIYDESKQFGFLR